MVEDTKGAMRDRKWKDS